MKAGGNGGINSDALISQQPAVSGAKPSSSSLPGSVTQQEGQPGPIVNLLM